MDPTNAKALARIRWEKGCTWAAWGVGMLFVLALFVPMDAVCGRPPGAAKKSHTISNIKQVALGLLLYAADNDERMPPAFTTNKDLRAVISGKVKDDSVCETINPNGGQVVPNGNLAGVMLESVYDPARAALVYETEEWPQGGKVFAFVDGHAKFIRDVSLVQMMEDRIVQTRSAYPPWNAFDNAMSYKFKIDGQAYLLSWSRTRTYEVLLEKWGSSTWEVVWQGTTMGTPIIRQNKNELRLYLSQPWFQIGKREPPAGRSYYEVVTVDGQGVKSEILQSRTMAE